MLIHDWLKLSEGGCTVLGWLEDNNKRIAELEQERAALLAWLEEQIEITKQFKHVNLIQISVLAPTSKLDALLDVSRDEGRIDAYQDVKAYLEAQTESEGE